MNKKHWNTIIVDGHLSTKQLKELIKDSYTLVAPQGENATFRFLENYLLHFEFRLKQIQKNFKTFSPKYCPSPLGKGWDKPFLNYI